MDSCPTKSFRDGEKKQVSKRDTFSQLSSLLQMPEHCKALLAHKSCGSTIYTTKKHMYKLKFSSKQCIIKAILLLFSFNSNDLLKQWAAQGTKELTQPVATLTTATLPVNLLNTLNLWGIWLKVNQYKCTICIGTCLSNKRAQCKLHRFHVFVMLLEQEKKHKENETYSTGNQPSKPTRTSSHSLPFHPT